jgi:hypothetical protein
MTQGTKRVVTLGAMAFFALALGVSGTWAEGYGKEGHAGGGHSSMGGHGMGMMHSSAGHLIRHLLKHEKEIGLTADQVAKLKDMQLNLDKTRIKAEADIQIAERELKALTDDEMQVGLRMTSIKARRDVLGLLTPEQRTKEKAEHEKMMQQHRESGKGQGQGNPHGGAAPQGANPHGANPHKGAGSAVPTPPSNMSVQ